jgi:hypothetical protein
VDRDLYVTNRGVREKTLWGYEVYYQAEEGDEGRYKSGVC